MQPQPSDRTLSNFKVTYPTIHKADSSARVEDSLRDSAYSTPLGWHETQKSVAAGTGLSILLVHGEQPPEIDVSNNNSICASFRRRILTGICAGHFVVRLTTIVWERMCRLISSVMREFIAS